MLVFVNQPATVKFAVSKANVPASNVGESGNHSQMKPKVISLGAVCPRPVACQWFFWCFLLLSVVPQLPADDSAGQQDPDYVVFDWQVQDGLPSARIHDVIQTHDGYLWLATLDGLARFDGVRFQRYYDSDTPGLASSMICCLMEDRQGRLWYGTESGEIGWKDHDQFHRLNLPLPRVPGPVERLVQTPDGTIWVASHNYLLPVRDGVAGARIVRPANHAIWDICATPDGNLWVLVDEGNVYQLNPQTGKMSLIIPGEPGQWRNITPANEGGLWVRDGQCVRRWQGNGWVEDWGVVDLQVTENVVLHQTRSGLLMIGTYGQGVWLISREGHQHLLDQTSRLSQDQVLSLCEDREQNLWVGTVHGLNRLSRRVVSMITPPDHWQNRAISTVAPAQAGGFWVGTEGAGLYRISRKGEILFHQSDDVWHRDYVRCVLEDYGGQIWTGVFSYGLRLRDKDHPLGQYLRNPTAGYPNALFQDSQQAVWVGTTLGAARYAPSALEPAQIMLTNSDVRCFAEAGNGSIWIGSQEGGLYRYDSGARQATQVRTEFIHSSVHSLHCATDGTLWVGTWRDGLAFLRNGHWGILTREQGLPDDSISDIRSDEGGNLWIGSSSGIFRINHRQLEQYTAGDINFVNCLQLGSGDGLGTWEILGGYQPIACRTDDGRLWYVTSVGLAVVDPKAIRQNELPPPVVIESMLADGRVLPLPDSTDSKNVTSCPAGTRQLEIRYTALSFSAPKQVRFRYRLDGLDNKWTEAAEQRLAYFPHLPPGKYSFEVTACNNQGVWNNTGAKITFVVLPLYWQTLWFKLLMALMALGCLIFFYRVRQLRLRALEQLRQQIARDLHDEVGANLGSISLLTEVMEQHPQPGDLAQIRSTADQTVDTLRDLVWIINPTHEHFADLVIRLRQIAAVMLPNIPYEFTGGEVPENVKLSLELRRNLPPFFKETLNNIRKHARAGRVDIRLHCHAGNLILEVSDNGVGFNVDQKRPGDGLKNFLNRAAEMRGHFTVTSQPGVGTTIRLVAPLTNTRDWWKPNN